MQTHHLYTYGARIHNMTLSQQPVSHYHTEREAALSKTKTDRHTHTHHKDTHTDVAVHVTVRAVSRMS